jgi:hypothetical protein
MLLGLNPCSEGPLSPLLESTFRVKLLCLFNANSLVKFPFLDHWVTELEEASFIALLSFHTPEF